MSDKERFFFNKEPFIDVATRCCRVIEKWGEAGSFTDKGIDECGLRVVQDFVTALGLEIEISFISDEDKEEEDKEEEKT